MRPDLLEALSPGAGAEASAGTVVQRALQAIRAHLGMDVAYVSEFVGDRTVFRAVDAPGKEALIKVGDSHSLDDVYCRHILAGTLPELIPDTASEPFAAAMPITGAVPIGKHMSVPIKLPDGEVYGMFCCLGFEADSSLRQRDLQMMRAFAEIAAFEIERESVEKRASDEKQARIHNALETEHFSIAYQPIWDIETLRPVGFECLSRFALSPARPPNEWFAEAAEVGLDVALELAAIRKALSALPALPDDLYLAVNASPQTILSSAFAELLGGLPLERIVLEITEHANVEDYDALIAAALPWRKKGLRLAVDDAGAGYSSLRHILHLQPDMIKLDLSLVQNVGLDPARRAMAAALIGFARDTGSGIVAEGVETAADLSALRKLGVEKAQGYYLARPMPLQQALALLDTARAANFSAA